MLPIIKLSLREFCRRDIDIYHSNKCYNSAEWIQKVSFWHLFIAYRTQNQKLKFLFWQMKIVFIWLSSFDTRFEFGQVLKTYFQINVIMYLRFWNWSPFTAVSHTFAHLIINNFSFCCCCCCCLSRTAIWIIWKSLWMKKYVICTWFRRWCRVSQIRWRWSMEKGKQSVLHNRTWESIPLNALLLIVYNRNSI